ncbi:MAG TPA: hypothetical protein VGO93_12225 [Candidatus Xenobia bacterium]|jgi:hypothetical protein
MGKASPLLHVRVNGHSHDVPLAELGLPYGADDRTIRRAVASWLDLPTRDVDGLLLDRAPNGNLILRPAAVFG